MKQLDAIPVVDTLQAIGIIAGYYAILTAVTFLFIL